MKKHDQVCSKCKNPAIGHVLRVGKTWVDVEWHAGIGCTYRKRERKTDVLPIADILADAVSKTSREHNV